MSIKMKNSAEIILYRIPYKSKGILVKRKNAKKRSMHRKAMTSF